MVNGNNKLLICSTPYITPYITPLIVFIFFIFIFSLLSFGCAVSPRILPGDEVICDQTEEKWLPDDHRPKWIDKTPEAKSGFMFFVGQSNTYDTEREARDRAYQEAIMSFAAYCGVNLESIDQYLSVSQSASSKSGDQGITEKGDISQKYQIKKGEVSQQYQAFVSRIKPMEWAMKKTTCRYKKREIKLSYTAHVLVSVPEDEDKRVKEYKQQQEKDQLEEEEKLKEAAQKQKETELRSVFEKTRQAYASLASGFITPALESLASANDLYSIITKNPAFHLVYPKLNQEYKLSCDDLNLKARQILEAVCLEKVDGDNQTLVLGEDSLLPLTLRAVLIHEGQTIPLKNIPIVFKDSEENSLEIQTDLHGIASYQPSGMIRPGLHRIKTLLILTGNDGQVIQRTTSFTIKANTSKSSPKEEFPDQELSLVVNFLYDKEGKVDKMYDGLTLRSEKDYYQVYFRPVQDCYVYIFQVDSHGIISRLFPNPEFAPYNNPVRAGNSYYIPTVNGNANWLFLDRNTGEERIYLLASREADNEIDSLFNSLTLEDESQKKSASQQRKRLISRQIEEAIANRGTGGVVNGLKVQHQSRDKRIFDLIGDLIESSNQEFFFTISFNHVD